jgi:hypothetical protein
MHCIHHAREDNFKPRLKNVFSTLVYNYYFILYIINIDILIDDDDEKYLPTH